MQPETIGSISYLSKFKDELKENTICGFNLSCVGDERQYSFVNTPYKNTLADLALKAALIKKKNCKVYSFLERGSDERQYCSPEISLPVCTFSKSKFGEYPEYHTSADDLSIISNKGLNDSLSIFKDIISAFELGLYPKSKIICEPQLSKRGLYPNTSLKNKSKIIKNRMNFLAYCNGKNSIFEICSLINCELSELINEYILLRKEKVIE